MTLRINSSVLWKKVDDEIVLVKEDDDGYAYLTGTGVDIWEGLAGNKSVAEIIEYIGANYDADRETIEKETRDLVNNLVQSGFVDQEQG